MKPLTEEEFKKQAEKTFYSIFAETNPYGKPFKRNITSRLLLYPFRWQLSDPWLMPVEQTVVQMGEGGFFVSALTRPVPEEQRQPYHWYVPFSEAGKYGSVIYSQENAIYSVKGTWGIICSDEDHAIVGGPSILIANIQRSVTDMDLRIQKFLEVWNYYHQTNDINLHWLFPMLSHIFGKLNAKDLLLKADLNWLIE